MSAVVYVDSNGDAVTEFGNERITVKWNPTGWRLIPPRCWAHNHCDGTPVWHVQHTMKLGTSQSYLCTAHLPDDARELVTP